VKQQRRERTVDSPRNAAVHRLRAWERDRASRDRERVFLAWGIHLAQEALAARAPLREAFVGPCLEETGEGREVLERLRAAELPIARTTTRVLDSIVEGSGDQGLILVARRMGSDLPALMARGPSLVLVAHGVQDPGNLGSMIRSAWAFAAGGLLALEGCADPFGSRAVRAAMGAHFTFPLACAGTPECLQALRGAGLQLVAADPSGSDLPADLDLARPTAIAVGSEGAGLPPGILAAAARRTRIPMARGVSSLNVHAAAVALLYEAARQRGFPC
jgi:TrmH family RNA methyltransferase